MSSANLPRRREAGQAEHLRLLFETAPVGISIGQLDGPHLETNPAFKRMFWWWAGNPFEDAFLYTHPDDLERDRKLFDELISGVRDRYQLEKRFVQPDGNILWGDVTLTLVRDSQGEPAWYYAIIRDITERKRLEETLARRSMTDELTGLMNRRGFFALAERELRLARRRSEELLLLYIDIDRFKEINDSFGHAEGDRLLMEVAELIRGCCRCTDIPARPEGGEDVLARMGGDEFVILAAGAREGAEDALLGRIHAALRHFNESSDRPYTLSLSIGFTRCPSTGPCDSVDMLLAEADRDMYGQKRRGAGPGDDSAE